MKLMKRYFNSLLFLVALTTFLIVVLLYTNNVGGSEHQELIHEAIIKGKGIPAAAQNYYRRIYVHQEVNINSKDEEKKLSPESAGTERLVKNASQFEQIECSFLKLADAGIKCVQDNNQIYIPFEYLRKKFDLVVKNETDKSVSVMATSSKIYSPASRVYNSSDEYLWFSQVNVESRSRVKYMSVRYGVPVSSQWNKDGHLYPIQIAQFGLSHFSKWTSSQRDKTKRDKSQFQELPFIVKDKIKFIHRENENAEVSLVKNGFEFKFPDKAIYKTKYFSFDLRYILADVFTENYFELIIDLILRDTYLQADNYIIRLIYAFNATKNEEPREYLINGTDKDKTNTITYGLVQTFEANKTIKFVRNICMDACKGLKLKNCENCLKSDSSFTDGNSKTSSYHYYKVYQLALKGKGRIENGVFREQVPHYELAKISGDYFLSTQNKTTGGWSINVTRKFDFMSRLELNAPNGAWYSSMAQGQIISLLCRLYATNKQSVYQQAAQKAIDLFEKSVDESGVRAVFKLNNRTAQSPLVWFEEYPTKPESLFVLNGFMYSIIGLGDYLTSECASTVGDNSLESRDRVKRLLIDSITSLTSLISMFDTGSRSLYDLRHVFDPMLNPNVARWDYHTLHVSQMLYLINMLDEMRQEMDDWTSAEKRLLKRGVQVLDTMAKRWRSYSEGVWQQNSQIKYFSAISE